jgi:radical SAM/Cys-rich protein
MNWETMQAIIWHANLLKPRLVDITGGAPEMNSYLGDLIGDLTKSGHPVQVRTNLTVLLEKEGEGLVQIYRDNRVKLVASLPCYEDAEVDSVRGEGTFDDSVKMLRRLNTAGYGVDDRLQLDLVFNPEHAFLPPNQEQLEETFKIRMEEDFGVVFNNLITITNMPVGRFEEKLRTEGKIDSYMKLLRDSFNPNTLGRLMCKTQISVDYDGTLFDCDFNLANKMPLKNKPNIKDPFIDLSNLINRNIVTGLHCFGCSAGEGSSCSGALVTYRRT